MKTKHFFFITSLLFISMSGFAQVRFGLKAGLNLANASISTPNAPSTDALTSFHLGGIMDYAVSESFAIQPGLLISGKGFKYAETILGTSVKAEFKPIYIDIPIMLLLRTDVGGGTKIFGGAGPYLGIGIAGNYKVSGAGQSKDSDINWGTDEQTSDLKRGDLGLCFGGGIELTNGLQFSINYQLGLNNTDPSGSSDFKQSNRVLGLSMGYLFGSK